MNETSEIVFIICAFTSVIIGGICLTIIIVKGNEYDKKEKDQDQFENNQRKGKTENEG